MNRGHDGYISLFKENQLWSCRFDENGMFDDDSAMTYDITAVADLLYVVF